MSPESVAGIQIIPKDGATELPANVLARVVGCLSKSGSDWVLTRATAPERISRAISLPNEPISVALILSAAMSAVSFLSGAPPASACC